MPNAKIGILSRLVPIIILGLITIWSTTPSVFFSQLAFLSFGLIVAIVFYQTDPIIWKSFSSLGYFVSIILLVVTLIFARETRGSTRWIDLSLFKFQTSEFIKPVLVIFFANFLSRHNTKIWRNLAHYLLLVFFPFALIFFQPDLGSAMVVAVFSLVMLFINGVPPKFVILLILGAFVTLILFPKIAKPYQVERLASFINPYSDPKGNGYHVIQSIVAIGSGGFLGKGVKLGTQSHLNFLPERHTDFIFASYSEEFGLVGISILFACYLGYISILLQKLDGMRSNFSFLAIGGVATIFLFQFVVNVGMNLGIMPITGITLPLFSYGGSSLISFLILVAISLKLLDLSTPERI